ncbi:hypothetical protein SM10VA4_09020 [Serratia marcescens]|nr:hypothetical protein SM10VA4_09020 [Serratia marcescens]
MNNFEGIFYTYIVVCYDLVSIKNWTSITKIDQESSSTILKVIRKGYLLPKVPSSLSDFYYIKLRCYLVSQNIWRC